MFDLLKAFVFGIIEGITEWLPVSSTGHLIILNRIMGMNVSEDFYSMFEVVIQFGAILAVVLLFWNRLWPFGKKNNPYPVGGKGFLSIMKKDIFVMWFHVLVSCIPAAVVGLLLDDWIEEHFYNAYVVAVMLILVGVAFILIEHFNSNKRPHITRISEIDYKTALLIGLFQVIAAVLPGTSRSGATILGALLIGVSRRTAAEYTFYLAVPVMFGASLLKLVKFGFAFAGMEAGILAIGFVAAFAVSVAVISFLMEYIRKHDFTVFAWYRIGLGLIVLILGIFSVI